MNRRFLLAWIASLVRAGLFLASLLWMVFSSFREESEIFHREIADCVATEGWTLRNYVEGWRRAALAVPCLTRCCKSR